MNQKTEKMSAKKSGKTNIIRALSLTAGIIFVLCINKAIGVVEAEEPIFNLPRHRLPISKSGNLVVEACDGKTAIEVRGKATGQKLSHNEAQEISAQLMADWQEKNPSAHWVMLADETPPASDVISAVGSAQKGDQKNADKNTAEMPEKTQQQGVYSDFTKEDHKTWELEQGKLIADGKQIFHSADRLKGKTGISCDMCHPNAANTHPETYPKYQVQLQRVAMLRDMINWCIENPVKGTMLRDDDPNMRALEAYIISQRAGVALSPGKH
jgi:thiosulfate dehydrogenase